MDAVLVRLLETVGRPIVLGLVHSLWQGVAIAGVVALALVMLRRRNATVRYAIACIGMLAILTAAVGTTIWFASHPEPPTDPRVVWKKVASAEETAPEGNAAGVPAAPAESATEAPPEPGVASLSLPSIEMEFAGPWIFFGWIAGVVLLGVAHVVGWRRAGALARRGTSAIPPAWRSRVERLADVLGLARPVNAVASSRVTVPTVVGWLRPVLLVPASSFTELTATDLELIIIHELAHVRRHDIVINYLQVAAETLLFYHPAIWWLSHRIRVEREHCCDDVAVAMTGDGVAYARALSEVERMRERTLVHTMGADGGVFRNRIRRLVGAPVAGASPRRAGLAGLLVVTLVAGLAIPSLTAAPLGTATAKETTPAASVWKDIEGEWRAEGFGGSIKLHFDRPSRGKMTLQFDDDHFTETGDGGYRLEREAGTFVLALAAGGRRSSGPIRSTPLRCRAWGMTSRTRRTCSSSPSTTSPSISRAASPTRDSTSLDRA
jgi:beta-lactamase regulating signal transducer with metallopeptidase domain